MPSLISFHCLRKYHFFREAFRSHPIWNNIILNASSFFKKLFIHSFIHSWETQRERQRHWQREKQGPWGHSILGLQDHDLSQNQESNAQLTEPPKHPLKSNYLNFYLKKLARKKKNQSKVNPKKVEKRIYRRTIMEIGRHTIEEIIEAKNSLLEKVNKIDKLWGTWVA